MPGPPISVCIQVEGEVVYLAVTGEVDIAGIDMLRQSLKEIEGRSPPAICLDLRRVAFIDAAGVRFLLEVRDRTAGTGARLLIRPGPPVRHILEILDLDDRFELVD